MNSGEITIKTKCTECEEPIEQGDSVQCGLCDRPFHNWCLFGWPPICHLCAYGDGLTDEMYRGQAESELTIVDKVDCEKRGTNETKLLT